VDDVAVKVVGSNDDAEDTVSGAAFIDGSLQNKHRTGGRAGWVLWSRAQ